MRRKSQAKASKPRDHTQSRYERTHIKSFLKTTENRLASQTTHKGGGGGGGRIEILHTWGKEKEDPCVQSTGRSPEQKKGRKLFFGACLLGFGAKNERKISFYFFKNSRDSDWYVGPQQLGSLPEAVQRGDDGAGEEALQDLKEK